MATKRCGFLRSGFAAVERESGERLVRIPGGKTSTKEQRIFSVYKGSHRAIAVQRVMNISRR
jgi:hypothetical protein